MEITSQIVDLGFYQHSLIRTQKCLLCRFRVSNFHSLCLHPTVLAINPFVEFGLKHPIAHLDFEHFEHVARLDVVGVGQDHAAFDPAADFGDIVLEPAQRCHGGL